MRASRGMVATTHSLEHLQSGAGDMLGSGACGEGRDGVFRRDTAINSACIGVRLKWGGVVGWFECPY